MGNSYRERGEYDRAVTCYQRALEHKEFPRAGEAWSNMGLAYARKQDYDNAIACYHKAFDTPGFDGVAAAWYDIGVAYAHRGEYEAAVSYWSKAQSSFEAIGSDGEAALAAAMIARGRVSPEGRSSRDGAWLSAGTEIALTGRGRPSTEHRIMVQAALHQHRERDEYARRPESGLTDALAVLRQWQVADARGAAGDGAVEGGGYLLKWAGKGLAIDAGKGLLDGCHSAGLHCREFHAVAVTQHHAEHCGELEVIDELRYEMAKREGAGVWAYALLLDADTAASRVLDPPHSAHRRPQPVAMDLTRRRGPQAAFVNLGELSDLPFDVGYFRAQHTADAPGAVGLRVECYDPGADKPGFILGYTGDTGFYPELCDPDALGGCDVLIVHLGAMDPREYTDGGFLQATHLGYRGAQRLIGRCAPKLSIITACPADLWDQQVDIVRSLRRLCGGAAILPGSSGLVANPRTVEVRCTVCGRFSSVHQTTVIRPQRPLGPLGYLCRDCRA